MKLSIFDLVSIPAGSTPGSALRESIRLAQHAESLGYACHWYGEHHLGPGRAGSAPAVLAAITAASTSTIKVGAAVAVLPNYRPLSLVEQFGTTAELFPGRLRLGLGRGPGYETVETPDRVRDALQRIGEPDDTRPLPELRRGDFWSVQKELLRVGDSTVDGYERAIREVSVLLRREIATIDGVTMRAAPGYGAPLAPWIFGMSSTRSARLAGELGVPYVVNHHVSNASVTEAVGVYRDAFRPSAFLDAPRVAFSVHAVVARGAASIRLARSYPHWIGGIVRRGFSNFVCDPGYDYQPDGDDAERARLQASLDTRLIGEPDDVAEQIARFGDSIDADEALVSTIVASSSARFASYELLAESWAGDDRPLASVGAATSSANGLPHPSIDSRHGEHDDR